QVPERSAGAVLSQRGALAILGLGKGAVRGGRDELSPGLCGNAEFCDRCRAYGGKRNGHSHNSVALGPQEPSTTANYLRLATTQVCSATSPLDIGRLPVEFSALLSISISL